MQDIPYDVWEKISTFLPIYEVKNLLCVNRALFDIAMNARYRTSTIGLLSQSDTQRSLRRLLDFDVAARVRTLEFHPGDISKCLTETSTDELTDEPPNLLHKTRRISKKVSRRMEIPLDVGLRSKTPVDASLMATSLLKIMKQLTSLRYLQIYINGVDHWYFQRVLQPFAELFSLGWSSFHSSLQSLDLKVPVEDLATVLPEGTIDNLETFSLQIMRAALGTKEDDIILATLLPFIQAHRHSLRSLTLDSMEQTNLSPLLSAIFLPHITHFILVVPHIRSGDNDLSGIQHFLRRHRLHLSSFVITIRPPLYNPFPDYSVFGEEYFLVALPKLEHLSLYYAFSDTINGNPVRNSIIGYIHRFRSSLISLNISPFFLQFESVKLLVEGFLSSARLKSLHISVAEFSPELITVLAANLPNLEMLNMKCKSIMPIRSVYDSRRKKEVPQFAEEMRQLFFPQWRLETLDLMAVQYYHSAILNVDECLAALLEALPNVRTICGVDRESYFKNGIMMSMSV